MSTDPDEAEPDEHGLPAVALALGRLILALHDARTRQDLFASVARHVGGLLRADRASVVLMDDGGDDLEVFGIDGGSGAIPVGKRLPVDGSHVGRAVLERRTVQWHPSSESAWLEGPSLAAEGLLSVINAPLISGDRVMGCLNVGSRSATSYQAPHLELMTQLASLVASSLERIDLLDRAEADLARQRSYAKMLEGLSDLARRLSATMNEAHIVTITSEMLSGVLASAQVCHAAMSADGRHIEVRRRGADGAIETVALELDAAPLQSILSASAPVVFSELGASPWPFHRRLAETGLTSAVSCPVFVGGRAVESLNIAFVGPRATAPHVAPVIEALARLVGATLERVRADERLRHAQKLESLGVLSGGLAHDFNNLMGAAIGHLSVAEATIPQQHPAGEDLRNAREALARCSLLTRQMLAYAGKGSIQEVKLDVNRELLEITRLLQAGLAKTVALRFELCPSTPTIRGDGTQLQQAVLNLITNAADAILSAADGGTITLRTRVEQLAFATTSRWIPDHSVPAGRYVVIECSDSGPGIPQAVLPRIFDPFFTTKQSGHGLGLSALLGLMRSHGGDLRVDSSASGARFELLFPERDAPAAEGGSRRRACVLLVDDDAAMQRSTKRMLEHLQFSVMLATDGSMAVEVFRREHARLAWVLMDQSMPKMSGSAAATRMAEVADVPIVLMTGYDRDSTLATLSDEVCTVIAKPFGLTELRAVVEELALAPGATPA